MSTSPQTPASNAFPPPPYESGRRYSFLNLEASRLRKDGKQRAQIKRALAKLNDKHNKPPLSSDDVTRSVNAVINAEKASKRNERVKAKLQAAGDDAASTRKMPQPKPSIEPIPRQTPEVRAELWQNIENVLVHNYQEPELKAVKVILASVAAHRIAEFPPSWPMAIAPAGSMKTEILKTLDGLPSVYFLDEVTPNTFISGKIDAPGKERTTPASLLHRIGENGILVSADFSTFLEMDERNRGKILSQLRRIYDGQLKREFGTDENLEEREWTGRITLIAGATPEVDRHHKVFTALGDRFVRVRWQRVGGEEAAMRAMQQEQRVGQQLKEAIHNFLLPILSWPEIEPPQLPKPLMTRLANLSELVALARTYIPRDSDRHIDGAVVSESNTRLPQELAQVGRGWAVLMGREQVGEEEFDLIKRVAWDSIPPTRRTMLDALRNGKNPYNAGLPSSTTHRAIEDLEAVGLVVRDAPLSPADLVKQRSVHLSPLAEKLLKAAE
jgi:hypothetical protein